MRHIKNSIIPILIVSLVLAIIPTAAFAASDSGDSGRCIFVTDNYRDIHGSWCEKWANLYGYKEVFSNGDSCFHPNQAITRMEFARLLHRALNININYTGFASTDIGEYYGDVANGSTGAGDLYDLATCGIIDTKDSFYPSNPLDRDEMIHFVMNAFYHFTGNSYAMPALALQPFADESEITKEYQTDVSRSVILGLVSGTGNNYVRPRDAATRAQAVTIVGRLAELLQQYKSNVAVKASAQESDGQLQMTLSILNNTGKTITIHHSSEQIFDFEILDKSGNELYRWSDGRMFSMIAATTEIKPNEEIAFSDVLDAKTYASMKGKIACIKAYIVGTSSDFTINSDGYLVTLSSLLLQAPE
jgi:hypothetical protein